MTSVIKHHARAFMLSIATAALLSPAAQADCTYELFNISSAKGTSVGDFIDQLSDECGMSVIISDAQAEDILKKPMNKTFLKNLTINEVLDLIIKENNLQYTLQNNVLKISYLTTKTYQLDYIISKRIGTGNTKITLSSKTNSSSQNNSSYNNSSSSSASSTSGGNSSDSGMNISSTDEVQFWETLEAEIKNVLSRPEDEYRSVKTAVQNDAKTSEEEDKHNIFINKSAGLVTVTGTGKQMKRLDTYIEDLQKKMQSQVLIDVKMYSVVFNNGSTTGIDWSQIYNMQNFKIGADKAIRTNVTGTTFDSAYEGDMTESLKITGRTWNATANGGVGAYVDTWGMAEDAGVRSPVKAVSKLFTLSNSISINNLLMFLKTQGDVYSISNPKIMTLNNQPALITSGTELFYKTINTSTLAGGTTGEQSQTEIISSVFSGVLLDITPEISKDGSITLRINPSISDTVSEIAANNADRRMPPDLSRRQISSVVTVKDGTRVVLGGLINKKSSNNTTKVPLLGDIPLLGYMFKQDGVSEKVEELVIVIEPHIVKNDSNDINLADLGYSRLTPAIEKDKIQDATLTLQAKETTSEMEKEFKALKKESN